MDFNEDLKKTPSKKMTSSPRPFTRIFGTALAVGARDSRRERLAAVPGKRYPRSVGGAGACPPEDCGGPDAYHARREEATGLDAMKFGDHSAG